MTGRITEETTANGYNEYYDSFTEDYANPSDNPLDYLALFFAWHEDPQYSLPGLLDEYTPQDVALKELVREAYGKELTDGQIIWYNWKEQELIKAARSSEDKIGLDGKQLMRQEYPSTMREAFQSGQGNVFDSFILDSYVAPKPLKTVESTKQPGQKITIYKEPVAGKFYGLGCDPSDGSADPAGVAVWDENYEKVAEWSGLLRPDKLAQLVQEIAEMYNDAFAGVENNMLSTILFLSQTYTNIFSTVTIDKRHNTRTKKIGWTTTGKSRDVMIDDFVMHFEEGTLIGLTEKSIKEMQTFVRKEGGKREHATGKHDDMLFADMIAIQMIKNKDRSKAKQTVFADKPAGF